MPTASLSCHAAHGDDPLAHQALFYHGDEDYAEGVLDFLEPGLQTGAPVAVAVPPPRAELLQARLDAQAPEVEMLDMYELGRNPARIIPAIHGRLARHRDQRLYYVGEPIWPGRSPEEIREATRHEALTNRAWPDADIRVLCPFDAEGLDDQVLADAERTHPWLIRDGQGTASPIYSSAVPPALDAPLPEPPPQAAELRFGSGDLRRVRALVTAAAAAGGLEPARAEDLVLGANEVATNALKHAQGYGRVRAWTGPETVICQLEDSGHIADPLAGRHPPRPSVDGGLGLWMVNQLCDLVEVRTAQSGTTIRLHVSRQVA